MCLWFFFCFKQKTAYEMRISDWSSDVCSSDLLLLLVGALEVEGADIGARLHLVLADAHHVVAARDFLPDILVRVERVATLVDIAEPHRVAERDRAAVGQIGRAHV